MGTINYDALIEKHHWNSDAIDQRKRATKLTEIARNLESLNELSEAEAKRRAPGAAGVAPAPEQTDE